MSHSVAAVFCEPKTPKGSPLVTPPAHAVSRSLIVETTPQGGILRTAGDIALWPKWIHSISSIQQLFADDQQFRLRTHMSSALAAHGGGSVTSSLLAHPSLGRHNVEITSSTWGNGNDSIVHSVRLLPATDKVERGAGLDDLAVIEDALRQSEEQLQVVLDAAEIGMFSISFPDNRCFWTPNCLALLDVSLSSIGSIKEFRARIHSDDRSMVRRKLMDAARTASQYSVYFRVQTESQGVRWVRAKGRGYRDHNGKIHRVVGAIHDITKRINFEQELAERVADRTLELEQANREMESFNYSISHNFRAPLRSIIATSQILIDEASDQLLPYHMAMLDRQAINAHRLAKLMDELLQLSRISRQAVVKQSFCFSHLVHDLISDLQGHTHNGAHSFVVDPDMFVNGDCGLLSLVVQNLLENARKFSPDGGVIHVGSVNSAYFVRDQGVGFDMQYSSKLFKPFERLVTEQEFAGTGIGLANVKRIIERHGGAVWAQSEPGKGATFWFTIP